MYKISTLNKISPVGLANLTANYIVCDDAAEADGILVRSADMHEMEFGDKLKAIARAGAGVNNIPLDKCAESGIVVFNTPGANANAVKELVLCGLFLAARNIPAALNWVNALDSKDGDIGKAVEKGKSQFAGSEIMGKTLGVVGLGAIGRKVAAAASALGMNIVGYDPFFTPEGGEIKAYKDLTEMLPVCDYVTLHLPANDSTKGMVNAEFFGAMKDGSVLLNFSRDKLVNEADLFAALDSGKLAKYVSDFANDNVLGHEHTIFLPHLGASTAEAEDNCATMAVNEMRNYLENGNIINSVNFPKLDMGELAGGTRIALMVKDMADPLTDVLELIAPANINVSKVMASRREDGIAYILIETPDTDLPALLFKGEQGAKVIGYRVIK